MSALVRKPALLGVLAVVLLGVAPPAQAAPPPNDDFANAQVLSGTPAAVTGTNAGATHQPGEPPHAFGASHSIWYSWTAPGTNPVEIDTCGSDFASTVDVYTGHSLSRLRSRASDDGVESGVHAIHATCARVKFAGKTGITYRIAVDGIPGGQPGNRGGLRPETGNVSLNIKQVPVPANDDFASSKTLTGTSDSATTDTTFATREHGEPASMAGAPNGGNSVWYRWTAPADGLVSFDTCGSDFFTQIGIFTGNAVNRLSEVASDKYSVLVSCGMVVDQSQVRFMASAGTTYQVMIDGWSDTPAGPSAGALRLHLEQGTAPANDDFANATPLSGRTSSVVSDTTFATKEQGEPNHAGYDGGASVWWAWTAPSSGTAVIDTCGSDVYDTLLGVYTGSSVDGLTEVASNDDAAGRPPGCYRPQSRVRFAASAGTTYEIAVDGFNNPGGGNVQAGHVPAGSVTLHVAEPVPPANDDFANAQSITGTSDTETTNNTFASEQPGEPDHAGAPGSGSLWYSWTAPSDGRAVLDTCPSQIDTLLAVYTGNSLATLNPVASNDDSHQCGSQSRVKFTAIAGTTYVIAADAFFTDDGPITLRLSEQTPPANDDFANSAHLTGTTDSASLDTTFAGKEPGEPNHAGDGGGASVWWSWTAPNDGPAFINTCGSDFDTTLGVYTGTDIGSLTAVGGSDNAAGCAPQSRVKFHATAGTTYAIAVDGRGGDTGNAQLHVNESPGPANDDLANAQSLTGTAASASGDTTFATEQPGEPQHAGRPGNGSIWFAWTAPADSVALIDACGSDFDTVLGVYTGGDVGNLTPVASNDNATGCGARSRVRFDVTGGTTYDIAVDGAGQAVGNVDLELASGSSPDNDDFANAQRLRGNTDSASAATRFATKEHGEPSHAGNDGGASIWYRWTAPASGTASLNTCGSGFDTLLAVYRGTRVGDLTRLAADDDGTTCGPQSELSFAANAGTAYEFAVDGANEATGDAELSLSLAPETSPPETLILGVHVQGGGAKLRFTGADRRPASNPLSFQCSLDGGPLTPCRSPKTYRALGAGGHLVEVVASDAAGNVDPTPARERFRINPGGSR